METSWEPIERYDPVGGNLALDLSNTVSRRGQDDPGEKLHAYRDLVVWAERTGLLDGERAEELREEARSHPKAASTALARAIELREAIYRIFSAVGVSVDPDASDVDLLSGYLEEGARHRRLVRADHGWDWGWEAGDDPLTELLWPTAYSAAELLTEGDLTRVKECGNDACTWLFVDMSKNKSRRWCDMKDCGNRAKARRHYRRKKQQRA